MAIDPKTQRELDRLKKLLDEAREQVKTKDREIQSLTMRNAALNKDAIPKEEHLQVIQNLQQESVVADIELTTARSALRGVGAEYHPAEGERKAFYTIRGFAPGSFAQKYTQIVDHNEKLLATNGAWHKDNEHLKEENKALTQRVRELEANDRDPKKLRDRLQKKEIEMQEANTRASKLASEMAGYQKEARDANTTAAHASYRVNQIMAMKRDDAVTHAAVAFKLFAVWLMKDKGMTREEAGAFVEKATTAFYGSIDITMAVILDAADAEIEERKKDEAFKEDVQKRIEEGKITLPEDSDFRVMRLPTGEREYRVFKKPVKIEKVSTAEPKIVKKGQQPGVSTHEAAKAG